MLEGIKRTLNKKEVEFIENVDFKSLTTIRCGGTAPIVVLPRTTQEFIFVLKSAYESDVPFRVVGNMSNILPPDGVYGGIIIKTSALDRVSVAGNTVTSECGARISKLLWYSAHYNLGGGEGLFMIPGTLGGMVYGNAGAYGVSISDLFIDGAFYDAKADKVITLTSCDMDFSYRHSMLSSRELYLLHARFALRPSPFTTIKKKITDLAKIRRGTQPISKPSLGSVFRRDGDIIPARLIDELGLKGTRIGGAMVSEKHAGFIVNYDNATSGEVKALVEKIKNTVADRLSLNLKREIEYL